MNDKDKLFDKINKFIESDNSTLPIFSAVSVQIQIELIKDDPDISLIEKLITEDQSLSSTTLKVANSAIFSGIVETTTVRSAIMRLGMAEIMQIVANDINNKLFSSPDQRLDRIMKQLWQPFSRLRLLLELPCQPHQMRGCPGRGVFSGIIP